MSIYLGQILNLQCVTRLVAWKIGPKNGPIFGPEK